MDAQASEIEAQVLREHSDLIDYTFGQVDGVTTASVLFHLKDKQTMDIALKSLSANFKDTSKAKYMVDKFNASEMSLPDSNDLQIAVRGDDVTAAGRVACDLKKKIEAAKIYERVSSEPALDARTGLRLIPYDLTWSFLQAHDKRIVPSSATDLVQIVNEDLYLGDVLKGDQATPVNLRARRDGVPVGSEIGSLPLAADGKIVPLQALFKQEQLPLPPPARYQDSSLALKIKAKLARGDLANKNALIRAQRLIQEWQKQPGAIVGGVSVTIEDGQPELTETLHQLLRAGVWSLLLIALMLYLQFGGLTETFTVMIALLFGISGAVLSLYVCGSKLSVNAGLGVILLNGLAVANSIMLVDCTKRFLRQGMTPLEAICASARARLRPILITSVTTALGMLPIALGLGEGGNILQPLGIAVAGGLSISALLTVLVVPTVHLTLLNYKSTASLREAHKK